MTPARWTYHVVEIKPGFLGMKSAALQTALNQLGTQGWELVTAQPMGLSIRLILKKRS